MCRIKNHSGDEDILVTGLPTRVYAVANGVSDYSVRGGNSREVLKAAIEQCEDEEHSIQACLVGLCDIYSVSKRLQMQFHPTGVDQLYTIYYIAWLTFDLPLNCAPEFIILEIPDDLRCLLLC